MADTTPEDQRRQIELTYGWLPPDAIDVYLDEFFESGNTETAWAVLRQDPRYAQWFPGNLTEDGRPRYSEAQYAQIVAGYDEVFRDVGLNPDLFRDRYGELIAGDVSPRELEEERILPIYERIVDKAPEIQRYYAEMHGIPMTKEAILASYLDPTLESKVLNRQITMAEIGGTAAGRGYDLSKQFVEMLYEQGMDWREASETFGTAERMLPMLQSLAARHMDPDDSFDIEELVGGTFLEDPNEMARIARLGAQERSTWQQNTLAYERDRNTGGMAGLAT